MSRKVLTTPYIVWGAAFIILPLFMVLYYGCTGSDGSFTLSNITAMADSVHYKAFWNSVWIALASTLICLVISYPLAYILSKGKHRGSGIVIMLFILPMWINFLLRVLALQVILSKTGILNAILILRYLSLSYSESMDYRIFLIHKGHNKITCFGIKGKADIFL